MYTYIAHIVCMDNVYIITAAQAVDREFVDV